MKPFELAREVELAHIRDGINLIFSSTNVKREHWCLQRVDKYRHPWEGQKGKTLSDTSREVAESTISGYRAQFVNTL